MVYSIQNNKAFINGSNGIYDGKITDNSVRYGRNAASNHFEYINALGGKSSSANVYNNVNNKNYGNLLKTKVNEVNSEKIIKESDEYLNSLAPLEFEYRYMPEGTNGKNIDKMALLGSAYEEMGKQLSIPVQTLTEQLKQVFPDADAAAIDINKDGKIDNAEYSTTILISDMLSSGAKPNSENITGKINNNGIYGSLAYTNKKNYANANKCMSEIYNAYDLGTAQKQFETTPNNHINISA